MTEQQGWPDVAAAIAEALAPVLEQVIVSRIAPQPAPAPQIPATTAPAAPAAATPDVPPVVVSEARRFFAASGRDLASPATVADVVHVLEHLKLAGDVGQTA